MRKSLVEKPEDGIMVMKKISKSASKDSQTTNEQSATLHGLKYAATDLQSTATNSQNAAIHGQKEIISLKPAHSVKIGGG